MVFYKVFIIITDIFGFFFAVVNPMIRNRDMLITLGTKMTRVTRVTRMTGVTRMNRVTRIAGGLG